MRQLWINVTTNQSGDVLRIADQHNSVNTFRLPVSGSEEEREVIVLNVSNNSIGPIFEGLSNLDSVEINMLPVDVYPLHPPSSNIPKQLTHVSQRSPIEVWLNGLQSIGSWKGFLGYALAASIVVWIALYTNTSYLMIGAMLVAPFAGPAMNFALGTATGDQSLLGRNLLRYFSSLTFTIVITALLSWLFQQQIPSPLMIQISQISSVTVLLPLTAGAVGALNLSQSQNSSLVPGAAVGALVAASLAPPAGLIGMSAAIARWDLAVSGIYLLLLQLFAINLAGALVFRYFQLTPDGARFQRGKSIWFYVSLVASLVIVVGMLVWQFSSSPNLQRSSQAQKANRIAQQVVKENATVEIVEADLRFTRSSISSQNTLLGIIYVERKKNVSLSKEQVQQQLTQQLQQALQKELNVTPLISVTVLDAPAQ